MHRTRLGALVAHFCVDLRSRLRKSNKKKQEKDIERGRRNVRARNRRVNLNVNRIFRMR